MKDELDMVRIVKNMRFYNLALKDYLLTDHEIREKMHTEIDKEELITPSDSV